MKHTSEQRERRLHVVVAHPREPAAERPAPAQRMINYLGACRIDCTSATLDDLTSGRVAALADRFGGPTDIVLVRRSDGHWLAWDAETVDVALSVPGVERCFDVELSTHILPPQEVVAVIGTDAQRRALKRKHRLSETLIERIHRLRFRVDSRVREYPPDAQDLQDDTVVGYASLDQASTAELVCDRGLTFSVTKHGGADA